MHTVIILIETVDPI